MLESRLKFTDQEREDPVMGQAVRKAEKAAAKADKAQAKISRKKVVKPELIADNSNGKIKVRLHFEETEKKPPSCLRPTDVPAAALRRQFHRQMDESEDDNVGVEAVNQVSEQAEGVGSLLREAHHASRLHPYRAADRAERELGKANLQALYKQEQAKYPTSNPISRWRQKQNIKRQYAAAKAGKAASVGNTAKTAGQAAKETKKAGTFALRHPKGAVIILGLGLMLAFLLNVVSSCSMMVEGIGAGIASGSYAASDAAIQGAEDTYCAMEQSLQRQLERFEFDHNYNEYHYDLDDIGHDPYVLTAILSSLHSGDWTLLEVMDTLDMLFEMQYILTVDVETETRYRDIETMEDVSPWAENAESYDYSVCTVTLENFDLSHVPVYVMGEDTLSRYALYMATPGNRSDLFPDSFYVEKRKNGYTDYDIPPEALDDRKFAAMIKEAEKYLGYPYVWGGSSPSTSFDCSGFVCWVINHSGWSVGRTSAQGLYNICTPVSQGNVRPGDLVFFKGTYDTPGISHVGIYVGNNRMIHCGEPISYTNLNTRYWQSHFYTYGRLP